MFELIKKLTLQGIGAKAIAKKLNTTEWQIRKARKELGVEAMVSAKSNADVEVDTRPFLPAVDVYRSRNIKSKAKTFIFVSWEIRIDPSDAFIDILKQMKKQYNAELFLSPVWPEDLKFLPPKLKENFNILTSDLVLNENLFFKYVPTHALVSSPLTGWRGAFSDSSVIIPGLVKELITEPSNKLAKQLMSTGSIGRLNPNIINYKYLENYNEVEQAQFSKRWAGVINRRLGRNYAIAEQYTLPSALVVDVVDNKVFLPRFITMPTEGVVYDKNLKFTAGKGGPETYRPKAFVKADSHVWQGDEEVWKVSMEMIDFFDADYTVLNDFADLISACYHEVDDAAIFTKAPTIEEEAEFTKKKLAEVCKRSRKVKYNHSNHDNFLIKYLKNEAYYRFNYNYAICLELRAWMYRTNRHPIIKLLELDSIPNLEFVPDDANDVIAGVTNIHGHQTISGRPAGFRALARVYNWLMCAHSHSPQVWRNATMLGTTSKLQMNYNKGVSGWLHCNGLIHEDGSTQLLPIINGKWRL